MKKIFVLILIGLSVNVKANKDSLFIRQIYNEVMANGDAYENLRSLCKDIGARITGSAEAKMAVVWGKNLLDSYGFDSVYLQEIEVPHWERGTKEAAWLVNEQGEIKKMHVIALGGSVCTNGLLEGEIIAVNSIEEMEQLGEEKIKGKVVFFNKPFDHSDLHMFHQYGTCVDVRHEGTNAASKLNAKAVIIRSLSSATDIHPHTGSMHYDSGVDSIAGAAISTVDSDLLMNWLAKGKVTLKLEMDCRFYGFEKSHNVIAEMKGNQDDKIITFGGHLDSWDVGEGAHDDGAGIVHSIEALRILNHLNYKPKHTLRCVLFMNEENGNFGGKNYARIAKEKGEEHICAIESDRGGFLPIGFDIWGADDQVKAVQAYAPMLKGFELYKFDPGYSGVDIRPLKEYYPNMVQLGMAISSQRYFDFHHAETDVFEAVHKRELHLGAAAMAAMIYLMDQIL